MPDYWSNLKDDLEGDDGTEGQSTKERSAGMQIGYENIITIIVT